MTNVASGQHLAVIRLNIDVHLMCMTLWVTSKVNPTGLQKYWNKSVCFFVLVNKIRKPSQQQVPDQLLCAASTTDGPIDYAWAGREFTFQRGPTQHLSCLGTLPTGRLGSGTTPRKTQSPESPKPPETWTKTCCSRCTRPGARRTCRTKFWSRLPTRWARDTQQWSRRTLFYPTCSHHRRKIISEDWVGPYLNS